MEKQERVVDPQVIDEVMKLPFHKAYEHLNGGNASNSNHNHNQHQQQQQQQPIITRNLIEAAAILSLVVQVQKMITVHCTVHSFISIPPQSNIDIELYSTLGVIE